MELFMRGMQLFLSKNFAKYFTIGLIVTVITTAVLWFTTNVLGWLAASVHPVLSFVFFFIKYFLYNKAGMFHGRSHQFKLYFLVWAIIVCTHTLFLWITVDLLHWSVVLMNPLAVGLMFLFRYALYNAFKMVM